MKFFDNQVFTACLCDFLLSIKERWPVVCSFVPKIHRGPHKSINHLIISRPGCYWRVPVEKYRDNILTEKLRVFLLFPYRRVYFIWCHYGPRLCVLMFSSWILCWLLLLCSDLQGWGRGREKGGEGEKTCCKQFLCSKRFPLFLLTVSHWWYFICCQACYWSDVFSTYCVQFLKTVLCQTYPRWWYLHKLFCYSNYCFIS